MIPKVIHYCWFGGKPLPDNVRRCLTTWRKVCPDYKIVRWSEKNFDIHCNRYVEEAYQAGKWAFVADYARLWALYQYGGIYLDTDVEVLKSFDPFLEEPGFGCFENPDQLSTAVIGACKGNAFIKAQMDYYQTHSFLVKGRPDTTTNVKIITAYCLEKGLRRDNTRQQIDDFVIYPSEYFSPKDYRTLELKLTPNTCAIHHYDTSWGGPWIKAKLLIKKILGHRLSGLVSRVRSNAGQRIRKRNGEDGI
jgi:hypothetical protein